MIAEPHAHRQRLLEILGVFTKIGAMSYGGPAIMGITQAEIQEKRTWLTKEHFLEGLALGNMLPGPGATQLGIFLGYHRAGWLGGVVSRLSFMLPAFLIMLGLTAVYMHYGALPELRNAFYGIGAIGVSLGQMIPHAAPDTFTLFLFLGAIVLMIAWRIGPLPLVIGGAIIGTQLRTRFMDRLREIAT